MIDSFDDILSLEYAPPSPPLPFAVPEQFKGVDPTDFRAMFRIDGILMLSFIGDILSSPWPNKDDLNFKVIWKIRDAASVTLFNYMTGYDAGLIVFKDEPETLDWYRRDQERRKSQV